MQTIKQPSVFKVIARRSPVAGMLLALATLPVSGLQSVWAQAASSWAATADIGGVRLGTTEEVASAALKKFNPQWKFKRYTSTYTYDDGVRHGLRTPEFLDKLVLTDRSISRSITVYFSGPGAPPKVIGVERSEIVDNPIPLEQFRKSLEQKYGKPTIARRQYPMSL